MGLQPELFRRLVVGFRRRLPEEVIHMQVKTQLTAGFDLEDYADSGGN